jgi:hypothetical protein
MEPAFVGVPFNDVASVRKHAVALDRRLGW